MAETIQQAAAGDGLVIDKTKQYKPNAGQCAQCGHYKTWEFKILNQKTGKQIPGHVTKEGFKIGDGNCPYWENISKLNAKKAEKKQADMAAQAMASQVQVTQGPQVQASQQQPRSSQKAIAMTQVPANDVIVAQVGGIAVQLNRREALGLATSLLVQLLAKGG